MSTFGQIRKITFYLPQDRLYKDFNRIAILEVDFNEADIEFQIDCLEGDYTNVCSFKIYGVSRERYVDLNSYLEKDKEIPVEVLAGYITDSYFSNIFTGKITKLEYKFNNGDPYLECMLDQNSDRMYFNYIEKTYKEDTTREFVIRDIIESSGYIPKNIDIPNEFNTIYRRGYTAKGTPREILKKIASDTNMKFFFDDKYVSVVPRWLDKQSEVIPLDFESGLITFPKKGVDNRYSFKMFLNHRVKSDYLILIVTDNFGRVLPSYSTEGVVNFYKVVKFKHTAGDINTFETEVECELSSTNQQTARQLWSQLYKNEGR